MTESCTKKNHSSDNTTPCSAHETCQDLHQILITSEQIQKTIERLASSIQDTYADYDCVMIPVLLKGAQWFANDLSEALNHDKFQFLPISVSSYQGGMQSTGQVRIDKVEKIDISGRPVLIVDDIYDTGLTLKHVKQWFESMEPAEVKTCVMFEKDCDHAHEVALDFVGLPVPDEFIVGYGLDYQEQYRELCCVGILKPDLIEPEDRIEYAQPVS